MRIVGRIAGNAGLAAAAAFAAVVLLSAPRSSGAAAAPTVTLTLSACRLEHPLDLSSEAARCGVLDVPEDRDAPEGAKIGLRVAVVPALNRSSKAAPLFLLAGGPGQSAVDLYTSFAGAYSRVNRDHSIVMVDQRGTGRSSPLRCDYPDDWDSKDEIARIRAATLACLAKFGPRVRNYTTRNAVRDLDEVRRALGFETIDLYGSSYGTRVAEDYMRRYPGAVHAVILDGVVDPERALGPDTPVDGERALAHIIARCQELRSCAQAYPQLPEELASLRKRFGPETVPVTLADPSTGVQVTVPFNRGMFGAALRFLSYSGAEAALLPGLIHAAADGNLAPLAAQALMMGRQVGDQLAIGMQNSVVCSEDFPYFKVLTEAGREGLEKTYQGVAQLDALAAICAIWPHGPVDADLHALLHSDIPTLLLSGEDDPVTPPAAAERAARGLTRHRSLLLAGEGHGQLATGCVPKLMAQFLDAEEPERIDIGCLSTHVAPAFFVSPTGPAP
jgi:pimeloyl-ACP methyl ester carboxylesterase